MDRLIMQCLESSFNSSQILYMHGNVWQSAVTIMEKKKIL